jgi:hypothetical protein
MTNGRRRADDSQADELLSGLYQQVTDQQAARFAADYDTAAGLNRYRAWLVRHTAEEQGRPQAVPARVTTSPGFTVDIDQNPFLPVGGREVSAIVTVTAQDAAAEPAAGLAGWDGAGQRAEIIIIDCSGSMDAPRTKLTEAAAATAAAVDLLTDGTLFAVIAGTHVAKPVYPPDGTLAVASQGTRRQARTALRGLRASGGTAIGTWLKLANAVFQTAPAAIRHAILLTDGHNQHETTEELAVAVAECEGVFRCDCRGVGTDWQVAELRTISTALLGSVDIVRDPEALAADFAELMRGAMSKQVPDITLQVWTPQHATVQFVKQVAPDINDLTGRGASAGPQAVGYATGAWAPWESRDYHVGLRVNPANPGQEMLAARVKLLAGSTSGQQVLGQGLVRVTWTADEELSTRLNPRVASYTGQAELAATIQEGLAASKLGDLELATARLGRAVQLAHEGGNLDTAKLLAKVVNVVDAPTGTIRLKKKAEVEAADEMELDTRSTKTVRVARRDSPSAGPSGP